jgi:hypothetical protein
VEKAVCRQTQDATNIHGHTFQNIYRVPMASAGRMVYVYAWKDSQAKIVLRVTKPMVPAKSETKLAAGTRLAVAMAGA